jgi:mono/diheme cytochrome c family protein
MKRNAPVLLTTAGSLALAIACSSEPTDSGKPANTAANAKPAAAVVTPAALEQGRALYKANCAACHGESGKGDGPGAGVLKPPPRDHTDRAYMSTLTDKQLADIIRMGGAIKGKPLMPSHPQFKEPELQALVAFVRSLSDQGH